MIFNFLWRPSIRHIVTPITARILDKQITDVYRNLKDGKVLVTYDDQSIRSFYGYQPGKIGQITKLPELLPIGRLVNI